MARGIQGIRANGALTGFRKYVTRLGLRNRRRPRVKTSAPTLARFHTQRNRAKVDWLA